MNDRARNLARVEPRQIQVRGDNADLFDGVRILSTHSAQPLEPVFEQEWAATISAGWAEERNGRRVPVVSRDHKICLKDDNGQAPFLKECLEKTGYLSLTISFGTNDLSQIFRQTYGAYLATKVLVRGDEHQMIVFDGPQGRQVYPAGTPEYDKAKARCKIIRSMYFVLADWIDHEPSVLFDPRDGFVTYRLSTGSETSFRRLISQVAATKQKCGGNIMAVPFSLSIENQRRGDSKGDLRDVPIWRLVPKPETGVSFGIRQFVQMRDSALAQSRMLELPQPLSAETEGRIVDGEFRAVDDEQPLEHVDQATLDRMSRGTPVDADAARARWFAIARGTRFADKEGRESWISSYTDGTDKSLKGIIDKATNEEMAATLDTLQRCIDEGERLPKAWEGLPGVDDDEDTDPGDMGEGGWGDESEPEPEPAPTLSAVMAQAENAAFEESRHHRQVIVDRWGELVAEARELGVEVPNLAHDAPTDEIVRRGRELAGQIKARREQPAPEPEPQVEPDLPMDVDLPIEDDEDPFA